MFCSIKNLLCAAVLALLSVLLTAGAQTWPARPVTLVVPFPAGGGTDAFARPLAVQLGKQLSQSVIIDNKGGAGGTLGASFAAKQAGDGYTFFVGAVHHAIAPSFYPKLDYDITRDLVPLTVIATPPQVVVVNEKKIPVSDLKALIVYAKANPGKLNFGSAGSGTSHHLAGELFKQQTKVFITHIPYRGAGPALQDLLGGQIDLMFDGLGSSAQHIRGGRIKALAVASKTRAPGFPDIPTAAEAGLPGYEVATWYGIWAVKGTPQAIQDRMHAEVLKALASPEIKDAWNKNGSDNNVAMSPTAFAAFLNAEIARWKIVTATSGAKLD